MFEFGVKNQSLNKWQEFYLKIMFHIRFYIESGDIEPALKLLRILDAREANHIFPDGERLITIAVKANNVAAVTALLAINIDTGGVTNREIFSSASKKIQTLLTLERKILPLPTKKEDILELNVIEALLMGDIDYLTAALDAGWDVNTEFTAYRSFRADEIIGITALYLAAAENNVGMLKLLLQRGARVDAKTKFSDRSPCTNIVAGMSPLHFAASRCSGFAVSELLSVGADPRDKVTGWDALSLLIRAFDMKINRIDARPMSINELNGLCESVIIGIRALLAAKASPVTIHSSKLELNSFLYQIMSIPFLSTIENVTILLDAGADPETMIDCKGRKISAKDILLTDKSAVLSKLSLFNDTSSKPIDTTTSDAPIAGNGERKPS